MKRIRYVIAMQNDQGKAHPFTGKSTVYHNQDTAHCAAHPEWATKYKTAADARMVLAKLPKRHGGYAINKTVI